MIHPIDRENGVFLRKLIIAVVVAEISAFPVGLVVGDFGRRWFGLYDIAVTYFPFVFLLLASFGVLMVSTAAYYGEIFLNRGRLCAVAIALLFVGLGLGFSSKLNASAILESGALLTVILVSVLIAYRSASSQYTS